MSVFNMTGGGGAAMNYSVKAYASELVLPASGKANEIAVITSTAIGEHQFSVSAPTLRADGSALAAGDVWFSTGSQSNFPFNALKKGGLYVYGQAVFQYDGSAWQAVTAKIWYGGAWVDWMLYLYKAGNECTGVTGGIVGTQTTNASVTKNVDSIKLALANVASGGSCAISTANKIDMTTLQTLHVYASVGYVQGTTRLIASNQQFVANGGASLVLTANTVNTFALDVSGLTGRYYVGLTLTRVGSNQSPTTYLYDMWAE